MNPLDLIKQNAGTYTKTDEKIATYILNDPYSFARNPIEESIKKAKVSKPALIRFSKKIGYNGYSEFKYDLAKYIISISYTSDDKTDNPIKQITDTYCNLIPKLNETININVIHDITKCITKARKVKIIAFHRTALSAKELCLRSLKIGYDIQCIDDQVTLNDTLNTLNKDDLCILYTINNNTGIFNSIVSSIKSKNVKIALFTMTPTLPFISECDYTVFLPQINQGYAKFMDEQILFFILNEILLNQLTSIK